MQYLHLSAKATRSSIFSLREGFSRAFWTYGSAGLLPVLVLVYPEDIAVVEVWKFRKDLLGDILVVDWSLANVVSTDEYLEADNGTLRIG